LRIDSESDPTLTAAELVREDGGGQERTDKLALSRRVHAYPTVAANVAMPATTKLKSLIIRVIDIEMMKCSVCIRL
jgi:hypothetical protein